MDTENSILTVAFNYFDQWFPMYTAWVLITTTYFIAQHINDNSIIDISWGIGFILQAGAQLFCSVVIFEQNDLTWRPLMVFLFVSIWGVRLSYHIAIRHTDEDWRYKLLRKKYKNFYLSIFMVQWVFMTIACIAPCNTIKYSSNQNVTCFDIIGILLFIAGFLIEAVSDYQLSKYIQLKAKAKSENKKIKRFYQGGLWKYSRHPNYFGEVTLWWGIYFISLSVNSVSFEDIKSFNIPRQVFTNLLSPIVINLLLRYLSGVPFLEKYGFGNDPEFKEYQETTAIFVPWFPKKIAKTKEKEKKRKL